MRTLKRVGSIAAGAVMLGAAISGAVSAGLDDTGLTEDFFYDAGYNPMVQLVVGEKGMATDSVAAGNIAAVIGNLAYTSASADVIGGTSSGAVVLGVSARGATGKFEHAEHTAENSLMLIKSNRDSDSNYDFYNDNEGLYFNTSSRHVETYTRGEFVSYSLACDQQERTEAGILKKGTYNNVHCLFCQTLCLSALENPEHEMEESISVDFDKITWYEDGLGTDDAEELVVKIASKSVTYILDAGYVPMSKVLDSAGDTVDFEWRGQFILFGEEYYTKDISGTDKIYLAKGKILDDISSEGYTSEYMGYKFKIDHLIYSAEYEVAGILLDVEKPDGTVVQTQISKMANGIVDDIEIAGVYAEEADAVATASIIVYDTTTNVLLEDGKDLELGGEVKKYWKVNIVSVNSNGSAVDVSEYGTGSSGTVLSNVTVQYRHSIELGVGEALEFPTTYKIVNDGHRTNDYVESPCSGAGEGDIVIEREGKYKGLISFTGDDGQRYNAVRMDQGPFDENDVFVLSGLLYEYDSSEELSTDSTVRRITLKDLLNGGKKTYDLDAIAQSTNFYLYTYAFEESSDNDVEIVIEPDTDENDSDVFVGSGPNQYLLYDGGDLYLVTANTAASLNGSTIGIKQSIFSGSSGTATLEKFEMDDNRLYVKVVDESSDLNDDRNSDTTDRLIVLKNQESEYVVVDFYDRDFNDSADTYFSENVLVAGNDPGSAALTNPADGPANASDWSYKFQDEEDTVAITPQGGTVVTIDYGSSREIESVTVCQPQDIVYATLFIGTAEQATTIDVTITKDDEGTEKTVGCCSYLVKEFGVTTSGVSAESVVVNPIVGNLVVPEIAADTTKNLIVVGGPSVNGLCGLAKDEIQAASGQYVVKKDGNKVYVAGWTAADTVDAGNALIAWLQDNVHA
jgi:S-layer protein (TIGR01564 family)